MIIKKTMTNNTMYIVQELHTFSQSFKVVSYIISFPSISTLNSSTNLLISFFLH